MAETLKEKVNYFLVWTPKQLCEKRRERNFQKQHYSTYSLVSMTQVPLWWPEGDRRVTRLQADSIPFSSWVGFQSFFPLLARYLLFQIFQSSATNFCNFLSVLQLVALMVAVKDTKDNTLSLFFFFSFFPLLLCISSHTLSSAEPRRNCPIGENVWTAKESGRVFDPRWKLFASWQ